MKSSLLLLAALGSTLSAAQAQTTIGKGTGLLTGSVGYHTSTDDVTNTGSGSTYTSTVTYGTFNLDVAVGGFVADNLALGLQLSHSVTGGSAKSSSNLQTTSPPTSTTLRVGPMVQYYKMLSEQFGLTAGVGAGYESDLRRSVQYYTSGGYPTTYYTNLKATGYYAALTPGIVFFPVPKFGLTATIGSLAYNRLTIKNNNLTGSNIPDETASSFDAGFGFSQLQFGASYYFGRK
ncbi:hypothetical protein [Hymenobacter terricola]|uniref:hypothetical protein n=1 Tax=Hymenobacter terricola TaxID=2819236 RepID=UPI001B30EC20|nr:hypothetical protein [Hymenobacter terricola]